MDPNEKARFDDLHRKLTATLPHCLKTRKNARTPDPDSGQARMPPEKSRFRPVSPPFESPRHRPDRPNSLHSRPAPQLSPEPIVCVLR